MMAKKIRFVKKREWAWSESNWLIYFGANCFTYTLIYILNLAKDSSLKLRLGSLLVGYISYYLPWGTFPYIKKTYYEEEQT